VAAKVVALAAGGTGQDELPEADWITVPASQGASNLALCFPYAVFVQSLAFLQSMALGLRPDTPNARGVVNRVVKGVTIHPWKAA
jgi:tagatose-6-phosphate ketose/aldose isomerase